MANAQICEAVCDAVGLRRLWDSGVSVSPGTSDGELFEMA